MLGLIAVLFVSVGVSVIMALIATSMNTDAILKASTLHERDIMLKHASDIDTLYDQVMHVPTSFTKADLDLDDNSEESEN